jgi:hypothetical protein
MPHLNACRVLPMFSCGVVCCNCLLLCTFAIRALPSKRTDSSLVYIEGRCDKELAGAGLYSPVKGDKGLRDSGTASTRPQSTTGALTWSCLYTIHVIFNRQPLPQSDCASSVGGSICRHCMQLRASSICRTHCHAMVKVLALLLRRGMPLCMLLVTCNSAQI